LVERFRVRFGAGGPQFRVIGPIMGFGVFVMMRQQMLGIRDRAIDSRCSAIARTGDREAEAHPGQRPRVRPGGSG
jgi:hypothetical protein